MLRICAEYADAWNSFGTVGEMRERNSDPGRAVRGHRPRPGGDLAVVLRLGRQMPADPWSSLDAFADMWDSSGEAGVNEFIVDRRAQPASGARAGRHRTAPEAAPQAAGSKSRGARREGREGVCHSKLT